MAQRPRLAHGLARSSDSHGPARARTLPAMQRLYSYAFAAGLLGLTLAPAFRSFTDDSYPFSTYPMFARDRREACLSHVVGVDASGRSRSLPPRVIVNEEITQAQAIVQAAVGRGRRARRELCARVAARVAASDEPEFAGVERVEIVTACYDPVAYFVAGAEPLSSKRRAACEPRR